MKKGKKPFKKKVRRGPSKARRGLGNFAKYLGRLSRTGTLGKVTAFLLIIMFLSAIVLITYFFIQLVGKGFQLGKDGVNWVVTAPQRVEERYDKYEPPYEARSPMSRREKQWFESLNRYEHNMAEIDSLLGLPFAYLILAEEESLKVDFEAPYGSKYRVFVHYVEKLTWDDDQLVLSGHTLDNLNGVGLPEEFPPAKTFLAPYLPVACFMTKNPGEKFWTKTNLTYQDFRCLEQPSGKPVFAFNDRANNDQEWIDLNGQRHINTHDPYREYRGENKGAVIVVLELL